MLHAGLMVPVRSLPLPVSCATAANPAKTRALRVMQQLSTKSYTRCGDKLAAMAPWAGHHERILRHGLRRKRDSV